MKTRQYKFGKHPILLGNKRLLNRLEEKILVLDQYARLVPTRFGHRKYNRPYLKIKINPRNPREVFTEVGSKKVFQRFKIECSSEGGAERIYNALKEDIL